MVIVALSDMTWRDFYVTMRQAWNDQEFETMHALMTCRTKPCSTVKRTYRLCRIVPANMT